jgi:Fe-S cluster biogenesis protein NfuA
VSSPSVTITAFEPPPRAEICRFRLSRPVLPGASDSFSSPEEAAGHALAASLLGVPHVDLVGFDHDLVVVAKRDRSAPWAPLMAEVRARIEAWFAGGHAPAVATIAEGDAAAEEALRARVQACLDEVVNPGVAEHGGEVTLVRVRGSRIFVTLGGGCQGCSASALTVRHGLTQAVRRAAPEVTDIVDVTDHAAGESPYYGAEDAPGPSALGAREAAPSEPPRG